LFLEHLFFLLEFYEDKLDGLYPIQLNHGVY